MKRHSSAESKLSEGPMLRRHHDDTCWDSECIPNRKFSTITIRWFIAWTVFWGVVNGIGSPLLSRDLEFSNQQKFPSTVSAFGLTDGFWP